MRPYSRLAPLLAGGVFMAAAGMLAARTSYIDQAEPPRNTALSRQDPQSIVFADASGRTPLHMSTQMQPRDAVRRLFDLCAARTGLAEQFRRIAVPDLSKA